MTPESHAAGWPSLSWSLIRSCCPPFPTMATLPATTSTTLSRTAVAPSRVAFCTVPLQATLECRQVALRRGPAQSGEDGKHFGIIRHSEQAIIKDHILDFSISPATARFNHGLRGNDSTVPTVWRRPPPTPGEQRQQGVDVTLLGLNDVDERQDRAKSGNHRTVGGPGLVFVIQGIAQRGIGRGWAFHKENSDHDGFCTASAPNAATAMIIRIPSRIPGDLFPLKVPAFMGPPG